MDKEKRSSKWLITIFYLFPFLMIGAYYIGWHSVFYFGVIPILILSVINIWAKFKYGDWKIALLPIVCFIIASEIGYLITKDIFDAICMGFYLTMIVGFVENLYSYLKEVNKASYKTIVSIMLFAWSFTTSVNSQIVTTFSGNDALETEDGEVYVEEVDLYSNYTYVKITIKPKHYMSRLKIWTSPYTYLQAGYRSLKYLGALSNDGKSYHSLEYDDGYGWDNVTSSYKYSYTLVFEGSPADGVKTISLIDPGVSYHGYCFRNIPINNREDLPEPVYDDGTSSSYTYSKSNNDWQKYIAYTTQRVNMRECSDTNCDIIRVLKQGTALFVDKYDEENGFYKVLDIDSNEEGYVSKKYISFQKKVEQNKGDMFQPTKRFGYSYSPPTVTINNNTELTLTLVLNGLKYTFKPYVSKSLTLQAKTYEFRASAPGVIPLAGTKKLELDYDYNWTFKIVTQYR